MKLPLFPLSSHILPEGRMALRIFEPRYLTMIKNACRDDTGFVICMFNNDGDKSDNSHLFRLGTFCNVIDFNMLDDGLLGVTVEGRECVELTNIVSQHDGLLIGDCKIKPKWICDVDIKEFHPIDARLKEIFEKYPEVSSLYQATPFKDPIWVINRWIELLPVGAQQKQQFLRQDDYTKVAKYLSRLID